MGQRNTVKSKEYRVMEIRVRAMGRKDTWIQPDSRGTWVLCFNRHQLGVDAIVLARG